MRLAPWKGVLDRTAPFATVCLDVSKEGPAGEHQLQVRWEHCRDELDRRGASIGVQQVLGRAALVPTDEGGPRGRLLVADADVSDTPAVDLVLPEAPEKDVIVHGPVPDLVPLVRCATAWPPHLIVDIDRAGADITVHRLLDDAGAAEEVEGGHDVLHKVPGGGWSHLRYQNRAEDSWERNATEVAKHVESLVRRHRPVVVLVSGDPRARTEFVRHSNTELQDLVKELDTGGRAEGTHPSAVEEAVGGALADVSRREQSTLLERLREGAGRQDVAVHGLGAVVDALARGQVEHLLFHEDRLAEAELWVRDARTMAVSRADLPEDDGSDQLVRADVALVAGAGATGASATTLRDDLAGDLAGGVGAILRWSDPSTTHDAAPSMPGHGQ